MDDALKIAIREELRAAAEELKEDRFGWRIQTENPRTLKTYLYSAMQELFQETRDHIYLYMSVINSPEGDAEVWIISKKEVNLGRPRKYGVSKETPSGNPSENL